MHSVITALLWALLMASSFIASAHITPFASPLATTGLRFILALSIMTPLYCFISKPTYLSLITVFKSPRLTLQYLLISGSLVGFFIGLFTALKTTTPLNTAVIYTFVPIFGGLLLLACGQRTSFTHWLGYAIGSTGAISVLLFTREEKITWHTGDVIYLAACALLALHVISLQQWGRHATAFEGTYRIMFFSAVWLLPITLVWGNLEQVTWQSIHFWTLLIYLTLFTTLLSFVLQQRIIRYGGASRLLAFSYTIPIWVAVYQAIYSRVTLYSYGFIVGTFMVFIALFMIDTGKTAHSD